MFPLGVNIPLYNLSQTYENGGGSRGQTWDSNYIFIPFVRDTQNYVNSLLVVLTSSTDTTFSWVCDWQYSGQKFSDVQDTSLTAREVMNVFLKFNNEVFGHEKFLVTDRRLYSHQDSLDFIEHEIPIDESGLGLKINFSGGRSGGKSTFLTSVEICQEFERCIRYADPTFYGFKGAKANSLGWCESNYVLVYEVCTTIWVEIPGSSEGGGPSGWNPPDNPNSGCGGGNKGSTYSCGPGWTPLGGGSGYIPPSPPNDSTIAENLKRAYSKIVDSANHYWTLGQNTTPEPIEYAFSIARTTTLDTACGGTRPGTSITSQPFLIPRFFAIWHSHPDGGASSSDKNQCFSSDDFYLIYYYLLTNKTIELSMVTARDYVYAIVITDKGLYKNYIKTLTGKTQINDIQDQLATINASAQAACTGACSMQRQTELGALALSANNNSSTSGIKIFKSPKNSINFTLLQ